ncbi:MAG: glycerol acyltransferase [Myxococcales bacterium]|nr:glycerol acyltransferase [Myxococcales bacterium]
MREALGDVAAGLLPLSVRDLENEVAQRLARIPTDLNEYGFDPFGFNPEVARPTLSLLAILHRHYFRVEASGVAGVPPGRVLLVANHAGQLPFDGAMIATTLLLEGDTPRLVRSLFEYWLPRIPWFNVLLNRNGQVVGTAENGRALLEAEECVLAFPEGVRGISKPFAKRYQLQRFGHGFARLALETRAPVVPVAVVGSEEQQPGLANLEGLARALGIPSFPITLGFPWLGPLGLLPLPVKYRIYFGEPIQLEGDFDGDDVAIAGEVERVRDALDGLIAQGRSERSGIFS